MISMNEKECQAYEVDYKKVVKEIQEELYKKNQLFYLSLQQLIKSKH